MGKFVVRRLLSVIAVVFMVTAVTWLTFRLLRPEYFSFDERPTLVQLAAVLVAFASVVVDVALAWLDPRTRGAAATS